MRFSLASSRIVNRAILKSLRRFITNNRKLLVDHRSCHANFIHFFCRLCSMMNIVFNRSETQATMNASETSSCQGVPSWFGIPARNDSAAWINEVFVASVNIPFCVFALLGNLAIILTIIRTPTLQKPCNTLLCSLAASDCLTAITAQPLFVAVRLMLFSDESTCSHQEHLFTAFYASTMLTSGLSFVFLAVISFDRHYALSKPLEYRARVTNKGKLCNINLNFNCAEILGKRGLIGDP